MSEQLNDIQESFIICYDTFIELYQQVKQINEQMSEEQENKSKDEDSKQEEDKMEKLMKKCETIFKKYKDIYEKYLLEMKKRKENSSDENIDNEEMILKIENINKDIMEKHEELEYLSWKEEKEPSFVYKDQLVSKMTIELVKKYPESYMYKEYKSKRRTSEGNILLNCNSENDDLIVNYMQDDDSIDENIKNMSSEERIKLFYDLCYLELPIKKYILHNINSNDDNGIMNAWNDKRVILVNGKRENAFNILLDKYDLLDELFSKEDSRTIRYNKEKNEFEMNIELNYYEIIKDYLKNNKVLNTELVKKYMINGSCYNELIDEMEMVGISLNEDDNENNKKSSRYLCDSTILYDDEYDEYLKRWIGKDIKWEKIYEAYSSDNQSSTFHKHCDNIGPTLTIIKSKKGWIFGGYASKSWTKKSI